MNTRKTPKTAWKPGTSGNPTGKRPGTRHRATQMIEKLLEDGASDIAQAVVAQAKAGDMTAAKIVMDRLFPSPKDRRISFPLPPHLDSAEKVSEAGFAVLQAVAAGEITPSEGATVAGILEERRKALETQELEQRVAALEGKK